MKKVLMLLLEIVIASNVHGQLWELNIGSGLSFGRLIPSAQSTPKSKNIKYGFQKPGVYLSPELALSISAHSSISIDYQYSGSSVGISMQSGGPGGAFEYEYESIDLHALSVGYNFHTMALHEHLRIGFFGKMGLAYGYMTAFGGGGFGGGGSGPATYAGSTTLTGFEVMPSFWTPTSSIGVIIGPNSAHPKIVNRFTFSLDAVMCWKDPYITYSKVDYSIVSGQSTQSGIAQYRGTPLLMQVGLNYSLHSWGR